MSAGEKKTRTPAQMLRLLERIEKNAEKMASEAVYAFSYEAGSVRWHQANQRAHKAEAAFLKAVAELRTALQSSGASNG